METVINIKLWDENIAAAAWDKEKEYAIIEFYDSFAKTGWDIAPLQMPLNDILRGERRLLLLMICAIHTRRQVNGQINTNFR